MKRVLATAAAVGLLAWMAFHAWVIVTLVRAEVMPALTAGSFNIRTSSMILNRVWEGNELYWLIAAHAMLMIVLAIVVTLTVRLAIRGSQRQGTA